MTAAAKILGRMRNNPAGWGIEDLKTVHTDSIEYRHPRQVLLRSDIRREPSLPSRRANTDPVVPRDDVPD